MQLMDVLKEDLVFLDFSAGSKDEAIEKFGQAVEDQGFVEDAKLFREALHEREKLGTTGVGGGIAIPHARTTAIKTLAVAFFRCRDGFDFQAIDGKPVQIVFMLLAPLAAGGPYLKLLARISRLLRSDEFRIALMEAETPAEVLEIIKEHE